MSQKILSGLTVDSGVTLADASGTSTITIPDNGSYEIVSTDAKSYYKAVTTNGSEAVILGQNTSITGTLLITGNVTAPNLSALPISKIQAAFYLGGF